MTDTYNATHNNINLTAGDGPLEKDFSNGHNGILYPCVSLLGRELTLHEENTSTEIWIPLMH